MRRVLLAAAVLSLSGCGVPQTRDGFKQSAHDYPKLSIVASHTANRRLEDVTATLERKWQECYSFHRTTTRSQGGMTTMRHRDTYHPRVHKVNSSRVEMTLQMTTQGMIMLNKVPEGGEYAVVLDLERLPGNKTKLSWYSNSMGGWGDAWDRNKKWADGKDTPCGVS